MSLNFPDPSSQTPSNTFSPTSSPSASTNGLTYIYDSEKWKLSSPDVFVEKAGDVMTGDLTVPNLISEGDVQTTSLNGGPLGGFRNQIINGNGMIQQRSIKNFGPTGDSSGFSNFDRFKITNTKPSSIVRGDTFTSSSTGVGFIRLTTNTAGTAHGASNWTSGFRQSIEYSSARLMFNKEHTLSFVFLATLAGTYGVVVQHQNSTINSYVQTFTYNTGDTPQNISITIPASGITDSETINTTTTGATVYIGALAGSNLSAAASSSWSIGTNVVAASGVTAWMDTASNYIAAGDIQLEPGPVATPFENRPIQTELALCQRYYSKWEQNFDIFGRNAGDGSGRADRWNNWPVLMRTTPTVTFTSSVPGGIVDAISEYGCRQRTADIGVPEGQVRSESGLVLMADAEL